VSTARTGQEFVAAPSVGAPEAAEAGVGHRGRGPNARSSVQALWDAMGQKLLLSESSSQGERGQADWKFLDRYGVNRWGGFGIRAQIWRRRCGVMEF